MPHTVESTITLSERDLARGATDLSMEENLSSLNSTPAAFNHTMLEAAVSIVRETGPKIIDAIATRLIPYHQLPGAIADPSVGLEVTPESEVYAASPVETIVVISPPNQTNQPPTNMAADTVILNVIHSVPWSDLGYILYLIISTFLPSA
jgi:hypothetical protein